MDESMATIKRNKEKVNISIDPDLKDWLMEQKEKGISESTSVGTALAFYRGAQYRELENKIQLLEKELDLTIQEYGKRVKELEEKLRHEETEHKKDKDKLFKLIVSNPENAKLIQDPKNEEIPDRGHLII
jgi:hypothetical protein